MMRFAAASARLLVAACGVVLLSSPGLHAQAVPATTSPDPVVAKVNDHEIHLSDVQGAAQSLPQNVRNVPLQTLYPMLLDQMIDGEALVIQAEKTGLDKDPGVQRQVTAAANRALQTALLTKEINPMVTEQAVRARYDAEIAGKPGEEEVHAKHILVDNEAQAKTIIDQLNKGADFAALAKQYSKDPGAAQGGDLGFFKKDEMVPEFADAAFALQPGKFTQTPVHTQFGWHVILLVERRTASAPTFEQARDDLRQKMIQEAVQKVLAQARTGLTIQKFNVDGSAPRATDAAEPPPAPAKP
jgi:peptidyl-prolyl cis-trans isomerase C